MQSFFFYQEIEMAIIFDVAFVCQADLHPSRLEYKQVKRVLPKGMRCAWRQIADKEALFSYGPAELALTTVSDFIRRHL